MNIGREAITFRYELLERTSGDHISFPAFCAAMCLELVKNKAELVFNKEYNINIKPLQMDLLVVKKSADVLIENEIGRIFRGRNIIEFKSPNDELNLDVYMKVLAYVYLYKAQEKHMNEIMPEDITLSFVRESYPREVTIHSVKTAQNTY